MYEAHPLLFPRLLICELEGGAPSLHFGATSVEDMHRLRNRPCLDSGRSSTLPVQYPAFYRILYLL